MQMKTKTTESVSSVPLPALQAEGRPDAGSSHLNVLRTVFLTFALALMVFGCDDKTPKVYQVGIICGADFFLPVIDGFKTKMTELGFIEGQNIQYAVRAFNTNPQEERLAAETFVNEKVDLIVTTPTQPSLQAHAAIEGTTIPLLFSYAGLEGTRLEEERRLMYVGATRAIDQLECSYVEHRWRFGELLPQVPSRFLHDIPDDLFVFNNHSTVFSDVRSVHHGVRQSRQASSVLSRGVHVNRHEEVPPEPRYEDYSQDTVEYRVGQYVKHKMYGRGRILSISGFGGDMKLTILFNNGNRKKLMAKFASLER